MKRGREGPFWMPKDQSCYRLASMHAKSPDDIVGMRNTTRQAAFYSSFVVDDYCSEMMTLRENYLDGMDIEHADCLVVSRTGGPR